MTNHSLSVVGDITGSIDAPYPQSAPWINVVSHLDAKYGGMSAAVPALNSATVAARRHTVALAGFCQPGEHASPFADDNVAVHYFPAGYSQWLLDIMARERFQRLVNSAAGLHIHGLWEQSTLLAARASRRANKPYVISAHGMLQPWALNNKRWKKVIYSAIVEHSNLQHATCLHALTSAEAQDYRSYGLTNPIAVIPNGVTLPADADPERFLRRFPHLRGKRLVLFLSRIHFKKGLDILCKAWTSVAKQWPDTHLVLAGPDSENTRSFLEALIATSNLTDRVTFTGMLDYKLKWSAFCSAYCFVLPSYSEGLSVALLEAMGMRLPVIVTRQCNLPEVKDNGCGWVIEPTGEELDIALSECLGSSNSAISKMGFNGHSLITKSYSWQAVGQQMSALYSWMQGGSIPSNVAFDLGGTR